MWNRASTFGRVDHEGMMRPRTRATAGAGQCRPPIPEENEEGSLEGFLALPPWASDADSQDTEAKPGHLDDP